MVDLGVLEEAGGSMGWFQVLEEGGWPWVRFWKKVVGLVSGFGRRWLAWGEVLEEGGYLKVRTLHKVAGPVSGIEMQPPRYL